jgi:hypothetical protein
MEDFMTKKISIILLSLAMVGAISALSIQVYAAKVNCKNCKDTGRSYRGASDKCNNCNGKKNVDCYNCGGTGKVTCPSCNGSQLVRKQGALFVTGCENCKVIGTATGKIKCSSCDGKKKFKCDRCEATGKQWDYCMFCDTGNDAGKRKIYGNINH